MNWLDAGRLLRRQGLRLFSPLELQRALGVSAVAARFLVHRYATRGALLKLRNGLYALADHPPSELVIANRLYAPSYVSFEFALAYYHVIPEAVYALTSATSRPTRMLTAAGKRFIYSHLKPSAFAGYEPVRLGGDTVFIATPEKALVDYLYFVDLRKRVLTDRLALRRLAWRRIEAYAALFARPSLLALARRLRSLDSHHRSAGWARSGFRPTDRARGAP